MGALALENAETSLAQTKPRPRRWGRGRGEAASELSAGWETPRAARQATVRGRGCLASRELLAAGPERRKRARRGVRRPLRGTSMGTWALAAPQWRSCAVRRCKRRTRRRPRRSRRAVGLSRKDMFSTTPMTFWFVCDAWNRRAQHDLGGCDLGRTARSPKDWAAAAQLRSRRRPCPEACR